MVEWIALDRISPFKEVEDGSLISIGFGNSSAGRKDILYLPKVEKFNYSVYAQYTIVVKNPGVQ